MLGVVVKGIAFILLLVVSLPSFSGSSFDRKIYEIQVLEDRVRLNVGGTYGTCGDIDGWWGWSTDHERHKDWLSLALMAYAQNKNITLYDTESSCSGLSNVIKLEGLYLKAN